MAEGLTFRVSGGTRISVLSENGRGVVPARSAGKPFLPRFR